jgi:hypothetical protein
VAIVALLMSVLKENDILCEVHADTPCYVSDNNSDNEILDSDSDTSTEEEESSELEGSDDKTSDMWCKTDKKSSSEPFFGNIGLNIVIDNAESVVEVVSYVVEVVSSVIGDIHIQLLSEQSNLYHSQNPEKWKVLPKTLKWSSITHEEMMKFLGIIILMGQVRRRLLVH